MLRLYCRSISMDRPEALRMNGPLLLAANHPNSFLDGIILTTLMEHRLYSLARGDAFRKPGMNYLLRRLRLLPVYRTSEGVENLEQNYQTFAACLEAFRRGDMVLIFSEGGCRNEWKLRPLRKGTARLAHTAWINGIPLKVLPVGINYSSFRRFGKDLHLYFGEPFGPEVLEGETTHGRQLLAFNRALYGQLEDRVYQIDLEDQTERQRRFASPISPLLKSLLFLPALAGLLLHLPFYLPLKALTRLGFRQSEHYDSVLVALVLLFYPVYLLTIFLFLLLFNPWLALVLTLALPFSAWCLARLNYLRKD